MKQVILFLIGLIVAIGAGVGIAFLIFPKTKMAYIDTQEVYGSFTLKKELEARLVNGEKDKKNMLDSMMIYLQVLSKSLDAEKKPDEAKAEKFELLKQQYVQKKQAFEEENNSLAQQYTNQVWQQLNQYIKDYGDKHDYKFILGTKGDGNVMYAQENDNITANVIQYVNERYNGKSN